MIEKISIIRNPLTIIAIFAGIAEVSGTVVLPFVLQVNQVIFIYFLIGFPIFLVFLFFITLNFNNKVLYAPSDYKDETNYIKINKYDKIEQITREVIVPREDSKDKILFELKEKMELINSQVVLLGSSLIKTNTTAVEEESSIDTTGYDFFVSNFENVESFLYAFNKLGIHFNIYQSPIKDEHSLSFTELAAIWLGSNIPLTLAQIVLKESKRIYPHLKYIRLSSKDSFEIHNEIFIGGSTESAIKMFNCIPLSAADFTTLEKFKDLETLHDFINKFSK